MSVVVDVKEYEVESTFQGDKIVMGIDMDMLTHILSVLTNLYSDKEMAVLREYSTNAWDAHVAAGISDPIEITLPNRFEAFLKIRDHGIGLSADDIRDIYSKYGSSTKRDTDDQQGQLGLGCKSALAYTDQFTLTSVKDGMRIIVIVAREDDGPTMTVVEHAPTDLPNGTEITIPTKPFDHFSDKAKTLFRFWDEGTVLVNGEAPQRFQWANRMTPDIYIVSGQLSDFIVMGNVAYPTTTPIVKGLQQGKNIVAFVPMGHVSFTPSREALQYNRLTKATIARVEEEFDNSARTIVQADLDKCATGLEAIQTLVRWRGLLSNVGAGLKFQGYVIPESHPVPEGSLSVSEIYYGKSSDSDEVKIVRADTGTKCIWVVNYDRQAFSATQRKKLQHWAELNGKSTKYYYLIREPLDEKITRWVDPSRIVEWAEIAALRLPRNTRTQEGRISGSFDMWINGKHTTEQLADDIDTDLPLFYINANQRDASRYVDVLNVYHDDYTFVHMPAGRVNKFQRDFPMAVGVQTEIRRLHDEWAKTISEEELLAIIVKSDRRLSMMRTYLKPELVDDPALKQAAELLGKDVSRLVKQREMFDRHVSVSSLSSVKWDNPLNKYKLYERYAFSSNPQEWFRYFNAEYAYLKAQERNDYAILCNLVRG